jgi:predicted DNA-binding transcriptional regulator AlpA
VNDRYYTASEAQAKLGLSKAMFFRKVNQRLIPKVVPPGMKQGVYPKRDIDALAISMNMVFEQFDKIIFSRSTPADQVEEMTIGIRCFGSDFITPLPERIAFQQKSDYTFHSLKVDGRVAGYVSMFRFPDNFLDDLLTGRAIERYITVKEVLPFARLEPFSVYIDVMAVDPHLPIHKRRFYAGVMVSRFIDLLLNLLANGYQITHLYTVTATMEGDQLVKNLGFQLIEGKSIAPGRIAYQYVLDQDGIDHLQLYSHRRTQTPLRNDHDVHMPMPTLVEERRQA